MATRGSTRTGDAENKEFGFSEHVADHKPGFEDAGAEREIDGGDKSQRFRRSQKKDIPQESLASRIGKLKKK